MYSEVEPLYQSMYAISPITDSVITCEPAAFPTDFHRVRSIISSHASGNTIKKLLKNKQGDNLTMTFTRDKVYGNLDRVYTEGCSPVNIENSIRAGIWGDQVYDLDQSCSQQRAMLSAIENDPDLLAPRETYSALVHYVENKTEERQRVADKFFKGKLKPAKQLYQALTFGGGVKSSLEKLGSKVQGVDEQLQQYAANMHMLALQIKEKNPSVADLVRKHVDKENKKETKQFLKKNKGSSEQDARAQGIGCKSVSRSLLALWGRNKEQHITEHAVRFFIEKGWIVNRAFAPCHDGLMVPKSAFGQIEISEVLEQLNGHIKKTLGFTVEFELHDMQEAHDKFHRNMNKSQDDFAWTEDDREQFNVELFKTMTTHAEQKAYWELHFAYCIEQRKTAYLLPRKVELAGGEVEIERIMHFFSDQELKSAFGNLDDAELVDNFARPLKFASAWLSDPDRRTYNYIDCIPYPGPYEAGRGSTQHTLNGFVGYPQRIWGNNKTYGPDEIKRLLKPFFTLCMHLVGCKGYDERTGNFEPENITTEDWHKFESLMHIIGHRVCRPGEQKLPYGIIIKSIQGVGKNQLYEVLSRLIGASHSKCSSNIQDYIGGHSEGMLGKLVVCMNEAEISSTGKYKNAMKELISEEKSTCNAKYQRPFEYAVRALILVFSNESCPVNLDQSGRDRRWFVFESNTYTASKWSQSVWQKLISHFKSTDFLCALRQYLEALDYDKFDYKAAKRNNNRTTAYRKLAHYFHPSEILHLKHYIETREGRDTTPGAFYDNWTEPVTVQCKSFFDSAQQYFKETKNESAHSRSYKAYNSSITKHNISSFEKKAQTSGSRSPSWTFTPRDVYAWMVDNEYVDVEELTPEIKEALGEQVGGQTVDIADMGWDI